MFRKKKPKVHNFNTAVVSANDIQVGQSFVDIDSTVYYVAEKRKFNKGGVTLLGVYAHAKNNSSKPSGWFTRENYLVIKS